MRTSLPVKPLFERASEGNITRETEVGKNPGAGGVYAWNVTREPSRWRGRPLPPSRGSRASARLFKVTRLDYMKKKLNNGITELTEGGAALKIEDVYTALLHLYAWFMSTPGRPVVRNTPGRSVARR